MRPNRHAACLILVLAAAAAALPTGAVARRVAHGDQKAAIVDAVRRAHALPMSQPASCLVVFVSTVNRNWAELGLSDAKRCRPEPLLVILHRRLGRWRVVVVGGAGPCPTRGGIPLRVQRDLGFSCQQES